MPRVGESVIRRAALMLAVPETKLLALCLTYAEASKDYSPQEREQAANAVLFFKTSVVDLRMGHFERLLLMTWQSADRENKDRLAIAFPVIADAWDIYEDAGAVGLREWVAGTFGDDS